MKVNKVWCFFKQVSYCCTRERSEISSEYALQFIQEFIL